jgi:tRNA(Ile)-lysidine synthase
MSVFIKNIQNFAFKYNLWEKNSKILIGVSGGPDSVCLTNVLNRLKDRYNFKLHIAHINYGLRGLESDKDEILVRKIGKELNIAVSVFDAKEIIKKGNLEDLLRKIRYAFFEKVRKELKFDLVAVAHNENDQAETVLMRVIRGVGFLGMSAMKPKNGKIIRPLLGTSRFDIEKFLKENELVFRIDKSNKNIQITRNRIRHKLIPFIEKEFNPAVKKNLAEMASYLAEDYDQLEKYFLNKTKKLLKRENNEVSFFVSDFEKESLSFQRFCLRRILGLLKGNLNDIEKNNIEEILKIVKSSKSKKQELTFKGLSVVKNGGIVRINLN